ncbi:MAG: M23 family metallopeptidase [Clostridia bacterium]|nr:M23 family metallopeptidase [Clostridia bacterium]
MNSQINIKKRGEGFKNFVKKYGYYIALALIVVGITLSVVLSSKTTNTTEINVKEYTPVEVSSVALNFDLPLTDCEVAFDYSREELVFNSTLGWFETHKGVDLKSKTSEIVKASEGGEVVEVYTNSLEGTVVVIKHNDNISTKYSSLSEDVFVKVGDKVKKGQKIGTISTSAGNEVETGAHLHFEIIENGNQVDPNNYLTLQNK